MNTFIALTTFRRYEIRYYDYVGISVYTLKRYTKELAVIHVQNEDKQNNKAGIETCNTATKISWMAGKLSEGQITLYGFRNGKSSFEEMAVG
jgi:hypothetical protein